MIPSRHFAAAAGALALLFAIVFVTIFGSAAFVSRLAEYDSEDLARSWMSSLETVFDLPGKPVMAEANAIDFLIDRFMQRESPVAGTVDVFNPDKFEAQEHFGSITGYAVFTRFGERIIAGGQPIVRQIEGKEVRAAFLKLLGGKQSTTLPLSAADRPENAYTGVFIPLERNGRVTGVVSIEIARDRFEGVMARGVQLSTLATALSVGVVGLIGLALLYRWGRAALKAQREAHFLAYTDPVTMLPNRRRFNEILPQILAEADETGVEIALAFSDVDNFKDINDTYGHAVGDRMLIEIGERLKTILKPGDEIFRTSGDHFSLILKLTGGPAKGCRH
jgi:hypothetical protein